jgi:UDP-N-acetylglucosamine--N-acetylmuramyl-(pentapeptide) pyrophosphoryl-undecaprenol N-acetylglucosamine transferase
MAGDRAMNASLILLAAGGTGGHLFPAEALAAALTARGYRVALATDRARADDDIRRHGIDVHALGLPRMGAGRMSRLLGLVALAAALPRARRLVARLSPAAVVGFGGYPSVPPLLAAAWAGIPALLHEQNAVLGRANRLLARRVRAVATSFPAVARMPGGVEARLVGNPVRPAIGALRDAPYAAPGAGDRFVLLAIGGSQGARSFSDVLPAAAATLAPPLRARLRVVQQARPEDVARAREAYAAAGVEAEVAPFFADIAARIAGSHAVVCRAGASTCAELACIGRPALFVPYPHATDDHQTANARALVAAGGGWAMAQAEFTAASLAARLADWMSAPAELAAAAAAMRAAGRPEAAERLADAVVALARTGGRSLEVAA